MLLNRLVQYFLVRFSKVGLLSIITLSILFFLFSATYLIKYPGLYYDETLFVNAALGGINNDFVSKRIFGIPLMLMPYIGALKAYIYYPIFQIFGVSPETIRLPCVAISLLTLLIAFFLGKLLFNQWLATLLVALMATDPAFIYTTRLDWGPVVLMNFFKLTALFLLFRILNESSSTRLSKLTWLLSSVLILGLFDKLNFIWFIIALFLSTIIAYYKKVIQIYSSYKRQLIKPVFTFLGLFSSFIIFLVLPALKLGGDSPGNNSIWHRSLEILNAYQNTISGQAIYSFIFSETLPYPSQVNLISTFFSITTVIVLASRYLFRAKLVRGQQSSHERRPATLEDRVSLYLFLVILFIAIYIQILFTKQAGGPHHVMMLFPLCHLLNLSSASIILRCFNQWKLLFSTSIIAILLAFGGIIGSQVKVINDYYQTLNSGKHFSNLWSPSIYQLSDFLNHHEKGADWIISADWGIHNQLFALSKPENRYKYLDLWPSFKDLNRMNDPEIQNLFEEKFHKKSVFIITHAPGAEVMQGTRNNFLKFANKFSNNTQLKAKIFNGNNLLFEVYSLNETPTQDS